MPGRTLTLAGGLGAYVFDEAPTIYRPGQRGEDRSYRGPNIILIEKFPTEKTHKQHADEAARLLKEGRLLACGAWTVTDRLLEAESKEVEEGFVTGPYERTGTLRVYSQKPEDRHAGEGWLMGFVVDHPLFDENSNVALDSEGAPKCLEGGYVFKCPLPLAHGYLKDLPPQTQDAIDMLHGIKGASQILPDYAYLSSFPEDGVSDNVRGLWDYDTREDRRVDVSGNGGPSVPYEGVAARGAASGVLRRVLCDDEIAKLQAQQDRAADELAKLGKALADSTAWTIE